MAGVRAFALRGFEEPVSMSEPKGASVSGLRSEELATSDEGSQ